MSKGIQAYKKSASGGRTSGNQNIVQQYSDLVYRIVRKVSERLPPTVDREDLFGAGIVGLLEAQEKFDPDRGIVFEAYARLRIKGAILDELRKLDHLTRRMRDRQKTVAEKRNTLEKETGGPVSDNDVAKGLGMSIEDVQKSRVQHSAPQITDPSIIDARSAAALWQQPSTTLDKMEWHERVRMLTRGLSQLPERNRLVAGLYYEAELTLKEIAVVLGVTESRVSQILKKTILLLKDFVEAQN